MFNYYIWGVCTTKIESVGPVEHDQKKILLLGFFDFKFLLFGRKKIIFWGISQQARPFLMEKMSFSALFTPRLTFICFILVLEGAKLNLFYKSRGAKTSGRTLSTTLKTLL